MIERPPTSAILGAVVAFGLWGVLPVYWKQIGHVGSDVAIAHRIVWTMVTVIPMLLWQGEWSAWTTAIRDGATVRAHAWSGLLLGINWSTFVWAAQHGHILDSSLGYFINPLLNIVLGVLVLSERLVRTQWIAVGLAAVGVLYLAFVMERPPWIALALATTFGLYGLIRKVVAVESVPGLAVETLLLTPLAAGFLLWATWHGTGALGHSGALVDVLLIGSGLATALPLALFAYGARLIPLSTLGLVQYIGPTLQFLTGILVFHEAFPRSRAIGFAFIWAGLAIYAADGLRRNRRLQNCRR